MKTISKDYLRYLQTMNSVIDSKESALPDVNGKEDYMRLIRPRMPKNIPFMLYRYVPLNLNTLSSIINQDVYMVEAEKMNDAFEGAAYSVQGNASLTAKSIKAAQRDLFLKSFSYDPDSILMWSHYGDANKGIRIGYDFAQAPSKVLNHLYPVQYSDTRFSFQRTDKTPLHPFLLLRKSSCWAYEKEFRLIYSRKDLDGNRFIPLNCISDIIFGVRTDEQHIEIVKRLVQGMNITLYQAKQKDNSFELEKEPIL